MLNKLKKCLRTLLEINNKDLFKALRVCKLKTQPGDAQSVLKKKEMMSVLSANQMLSRGSRPAFSACGWSETVILQVTCGPDNGRQAVLRMHDRWTVHASIPSLVLQRVIAVLSGGVMYIQALNQD